MGARGLARRTLWWTTAIVATWLITDQWTQVRFGANALSYLPFLWAAARTVGGANQAQWAGDPIDIALSLGPLLLVAAVLTYTLHALFDSLVARHLAGPRRATQRRRWLLAVAAVWIAIPLLPAQRLLGEGVVDRLALTLPHAFGVAAQWESLARRDQSPVLLAVVPRPWEHPDGAEVWIHNPTRNTHSLDGWSLETGAGGRIALTGEVPGHDFRVLRFERARLGISESHGKLALLDRDGSVRGRLQYEGEPVERGSALFYRDGAGERRTLQHIGLVAQRDYAALFDAIHAPRSLSFAASVPVPATQAPDIVVLVVESFHPGVVNENLLARLHTWGQGGLVARRHYAATNASHMGLFSLLYGRLPLVYDSVLDSGQAPSLISILRELGYQAHMVSAGSVAAWRRMDEFLNARVFDSLIQPTPAQVREFWHHWPAADAEALASMKELLGRPEPTFVLGFLMTTHYPYPFPDEFRRYEPVSNETDTRSWDELLHVELDRDLLWNRYRNSALSLEAKLMDFVEGLDPTRTIVVVTGDHGESFGEDGTLIHGSRASEVQNRVPFLMAGAGVQPRVVDDFTSHMDLLPTLVHAISGVDDPLHGAEGRDLLGPLPGDGGVLVSPYKPTQPQDLLLVREAGRLLFRVRSDRPELEAFAFVDAGGLPVLSVGDEKVGDAGGWAAAMRRELERVAGTR
jgi:hypothetical protein